MGLNHFIDKMDINDVFIAPVTDPATSAGKQNGGAGKQWGSAELQHKEQLKQKLQG